MTIWALNDLVNVPVVSNEAATEIGRVHEVLFNPLAHALLGLVVKPAQEHTPLLFVPLSGIRAIGKDAITIESVTVAELFLENAEAQTVSAADGYRSGMDVMTQSGESVGKVDRINVTEDGTVESYHSSSGFLGSKHDIEPSEIQSASKDMIIIVDAARDGAAKTIRTA